MRKSGYRGVRWCARVRAAGVALVALDIPAMLVWASVLLFLFPGLLLYGP